jgi:hypothetical protein
VRCRSEEAGSAGEAWVSAVVCAGVAEWDEEWVEATPIPSAASIPGSPEGGGLMAVDSIPSQGPGHIRLTPIVALARHTPGSENRQEAFS